MSDQDTYEPGPRPSFMDRRDPVEVRVEREAALFYDELGILEPEPKKAEKPDDRKR
jgi:hypothetical protein